jgi:hypothetical protein
LILAHGVTRGLAPEEQASVDFWLAVIAVVIVVLITGLLGLALAIRFIARRTTRPCPSCMNFISNKATSCPKCGKPVGPGVFQFS